MPEIDKITVANSDGELVTYNIKGSGAKVPTKTSELTNDSGFITSSAVGDGRITFTQGGTQKGSFTVNQSGNTTIELDGGGGGTVTIEALDFNNVAEMKASSKLVAGAFARTAAYASVNDGGAATYKIRTKASGDTDSDTTIFTNNGLVAELVLSDPEIVREKQGNTNWFKCYSNNLTGRNKSIKSKIHQTQEKDNTIELMYNENTVSNLCLANTNSFGNKTAIDVKTPSQRNKFDSILIEKGYEYGIKIPTSYYSQFNDVWAAGKTGILIGNPDKTGDWIGVLDFNACHFNASDMAFKVVAKDTNTVCVDKSSFENNYKCMDNSGVVYVRNTYFGDTPLDGAKTVGVLDAQAGSRTYFTDCTIGYVSNSYSDNRKTSIFDLKGTPTTGAKVFVKGGTLNISDNAHASSVSAIYDSSSALDQIFIDNARFVPSTASKNHNQCPYRLLEGYSPLRSENPITNYVINGTFKNPILNDAILNHNDHASIDPVLTNPFGGKCITYTRSGEATQGYTRMFFKVPKHLVGKKMVLEMYGWSNIGSFAVSSPNLGLNNVYYEFNLRTHRNNPRMVRVEVTPTKEDGEIYFFLHWGNTNPDASYLLAGVILKELEYKDLMSCYKDQDVMYSRKAPTNTTAAKKGDIVYATSDTTEVNALGWIFNGTAWVPYGTF